MHRANQVLLTGPAGLVGSAVLSRLVRDGVAVRALAHATPVPDAPERIPGDLGDTASLAAAVSGCDTVVHCAGIMTGDATAMQTVNADGTANLCEAALAAGVSRVVLSSTTALYRPGELHDAGEDTAVAATEPYSASKLAAERRAREILGDRLTVVRAVTVYASRPCPFVALLRDVVRSQPIPDSADAPVDLVHADDLADALAAAANGRGPGGCFHVAGRPRPGFRELIELAANTLGVTPRWTAAAPAQFHEAVHRAATVPRSISIDRAQRELGYEPCHDWRVELRAALSRS